MYEAGLIYRRLTGLYLVVWIGHSRRSPFPAHPLGCLEEWREGSLRPLAQLFCDVLPRGKVRSLHRSPPPLVDREASWRSRVVLPIFRKHPRVSHEREEEEEKVALPPLCSPRRQEESPPSLAPLRKSGVGRWLISSEGGEGAAPLQPVRLPCRL